MVEAAVDKEGAGGEIKLAEELISIIKTSFEPSAAALAEDSSVRRVSMSSVAVLIWQVLTDAVSVSAAYWSF